MVSAVDPKAKNRATFGRQVFGRSKRRECVGVLRQWRHLCRSDTQICIIVCVRTNPHLNTHPYTHAPTPAHAHRSAHPSPHIPTPTHMSVPRLIGLQPTCTITPCGPTHHGSTIMAPTHHSPNPSWPQRIMAPTQHGPTCTNWSCRLTPAAAAAANKFSFSAELRSMPAILTHTPHKAYMHMNGCKIHR